MKYFDDFEINFHAIFDNDSGTIVQKISDIHPPAHRTPERNEVPVKGEGNTKES